MFEPAMEKIDKTDEEWRAELTPQRYDILRKKGTEAPFAGEYVNCHDDGVYCCAGCGNQLFSSDTKFESGSGWPSFTDAIEQGNVELHQDLSHMMIRTEVRCIKCGGHLGHVFEDGPGPTGLRYCINSAAIDLDRR